MYNYTEVKYKKEQVGGFFYVLNQRVNEYFKEKKLTRKATAYGKFKAILFLSVYIGLATTICLANGNVGLMLACFAYLGFHQICCALILGHEGVHGSFSNNPKLNKLMSYGFDLIGTSGYIWGMRHVHSHHPYPMVRELDLDIRQNEMLTLIPVEKPKKMWKYQHIYAPFLYLLYTLSVVFYRDYVDFFSKRIGNKRIKHGVKELTELFIAKVVYFSHTLILPLMLSGCGWGWVIVGFLLMHVMSSITAASALFPAHIHEDAIFPLPDPKTGELEFTWAEHQIKTTMDFGTNNPVVAFFWGGINYHVIHHLFPTVSHIHFRKIQGIFEKTADEFGIKYNVQPSLFKALLSHWRSLRKNGLPLAQVRELSEIV
jgi:linoleoyl-CoA desaturase